MATTNKLLGVTALISFVIIGAANLQKKDPGLPPSREWIGLSIVFFMLAGASDLGLTSAGGMAVLVMVSILIARGEDALKFAGTKITNKEDKEKTLKNEVIQDRRNRVGTARPGQPGYGHLAPSNSGGVTGPGA